VGPGQKPSLFGAASKLQFGMPIDQAKAASPDLFGPTPYNPPGFADIQMKGESNAYRKLGTIRLTLSKKTALIDVVAIWGDPVKGIDSLSQADVYFWFNPEAHVRAILKDDPKTPDTSDLLIEAYMPMAELIGTSKDRMGWEKERLDGMSEQRANDVLGDYIPRTPLDSPNQTVCDVGILVLPPVEYDTTFTRIRIGCSGRTPGTRTLAGGYELITSYQNYFAMKDDLAKLLVAKFGDPTPRPGSSREFTSSDVRVLMSDRPGEKAVHLQVSKPK
jgi:hypothetical protein